MKLRYIMLYSVRNSWAKYGLEAIIMHWIFVFTLNNNAV